MDLNINNKTYTVQAEGRESLLTILREYVGLTGTKYGCGEGACGACTVLVNQAAVRSCSVPVESVVGKKITTVEGLAQSGTLHPVQEASLQEDSFQCAYCAPGMIMSAVALLAKNADPSKEEILTAMQGNVCRCGTYSRIMKSIEKAVELQKS